MKYARFARLFMAFWRLPPPIKLQRKVLHFLELGTKKQEQRWICFGERSTVYNYELGGMSYKLISNKCPICWLLAKYTIL